MIRKSAGSNQTGTPPPSGSRRSFHSSPPYHIVSPRDSSSARLMFKQPAADSNSNDSRLISGRISQPARPRLEVVAAGGRSRRATRACDNCRRLKEKCNGGTPCDRCKKSARQCVFTNAFRRTRNPQNPRPPRSVPPPGPVDPNVFFDIERIQTLENIVQYFTGIKQFTKPKLQEILSAIQSDDESLPSSHVRRGGGFEEQDNLDELGDSRTLSEFEELSHSDFSRRVQQKMETGSERWQSQYTSDIIPAELLLSRDFIVQEAVSLFPPCDVALLLFDVFFDVAQTNYCYVDEDFVRYKLSELYTLSSSPPTITDAPWVCTTLMIFAIGTQFAHLASNDKTPGRRANGETLNLNSAVDDTLALAFFRKATSLVPDVLAIDSLQGVQAFALLGIYILPLDPAGLSCTYLGIAIKIATHNGMHKKRLNCPKNREFEIRNRIWWTVYSLERRICILHGRPTSILRSQVDAELPVDSPELQPSGRVNTFHNVMAQKGITDMMEDAREAILALKQIDNSKIALLAQNVVRVKSHLETWWESLPTETFCRDLTPDKPLFRSNIHLALTYHLVHIIMGRSFIFDESAPKQDDSNVGKWAVIRDELIDNCIKSAVTSIKLCQILQDEFGLSKSSYTEFTSCCAAVLALVARRIFTKDSLLKDLCDQGLALIKHMSTGVFAMSCEKRGLEILEMALQQLDGCHQQSLSLNETGYAEFRRWIAMQQIVPGETLHQDQVPSQVDWATEGISTQGMIHEDRMSAGPEFAPSMFADLNSLPGLDEWFQHSID